MILYHGSNQDFNEVDLSKSKDQVSFHTDKAISLLKLLNKRKTSSDKIMYNGQELTLLIAQKIEYTVSIIAQMENIPFDSAYAGFSASQTYKSLQNPTSMLWAENAEFIADEYYRQTAIKITSPNLSPKTVFPPQNLSF